MNIENMFDKPDVKQLVHAFSLLDDEKDIQAFLTDICTPREICDLSQRLQVARYLDEGEILFLYEKDFFPESMLRELLYLAKKKNDPEMLSLFMNFW